MTSFEQFWKDERIPKRMKRCGPAPVRAAIKKRNLDAEGLEKVLASLKGYERNKPDYADYCMLSTYINQERDEVEWDEMDAKPVDTTTDRQKFVAFISKKLWRPEWGDEPTLTEAKARLEALGSMNYENVVRMKG